MVNGVLKSIKGNCCFVQVGQQGRLPTIGRLHKIETPDSNFNSMTIGERIQVKILKVSQDAQSDRLLIELTRRPEHLTLPTGQLSDQLQQLLSLDTLQEGQKLQALITDVSPESSHPVQIQISPFV